jgi:hypothetical protein
VIGALRQLVINGVVDFNAVEVGDPHRVDIVLADCHYVATKVVAIELVSTDASDAGKDLSRNQKRHEQRQTAAKRRRRNIDQIILMTAEGMPAKVINTVGIKRHIIGQVEVIHQRLQEYSSGPVIRHGICPRDAFRSRIFFVRTDGIDIKPSAIHEKAALRAGSKA